MTRNLGGNGFYAPTTDQIVCISLDNIFLTKHDFDLLSTLGQFWHKNCWWSVFKELTVTQRWWDACSIFHQYQLNVNPTYKMTIEFTGKRYLPLWLWETRWRADPWHRLTYTQDCRALRSVSSSQTYPDPKPANETMVWTGQSLIADYTTSYGQSSPQQNVTEKVDIFS